MKSKWRWLVLAVVAGIGAGSVTLSVSAQDVRGEIKCDGSSTVYLITEAMASNFTKQNPKVNISIGVSGTGGGFKKFAAGETDIQDASRSIKPPEAEKCKANGINYVELQVAWDGLAVVVNPENDWARKMTVAQLKKIWHPETADFKNAKKWSDVNASWPNEEIKLFGPGSDSGTFDYFTEVINGKEKESRIDYQSSEDDNNLVKGVAGNKYALGYFGLAYYEANKNKLGVVAIAEKEGADFVEPTLETVLTRKYKPLGRPLLIYVKTSSLKNPAVKEFVNFYLRRSDLVSGVKYVPMSSRQRVAQQEKLEKAVAGGE